LPYGTFESAATGVAGLERVLLTAWVGALWSIGYLVAPVLFMQLSEPRQAGALAGELFTLVAYLSVLCGGVLLALQWPRAPRRGNWRGWVVLVMVLLIVAGEFAVRRFMVPGSEHFARLHGIAQALYLAASLLGLALVAAGPASASARSECSR
jgi:hypothetical protein